MFFASGNFYRKAARRACALVLLLASATVEAKPAPDSLSFATGVFDLLRPKWRTWEFSAEYKFHPNWMKSPNRYLEFRPLVGVMATADVSTYIYLGINFDLLFCDHILFAPGFAAGYYAKGCGKDMGYPIEFRSGVELAWQFSDWRRLGVHFYHISNASLGKRNPGEESLVFFYDIPLAKGFPFYRD